MMDFVGIFDSSPAPVYGQMMKSYIWLHTVDGSIQQVEQEVAMFCPVICHEIHAGKGSAKSHAICLPQRVNPAMLSLILDYCRFHQVPGHSNKVWTLFFNGCGFYPIPIYLKFKQFLTFYVG